MHCALIYVPLRLAWLCLANDSTTLGTLKQLAAGTFAYAAPELLMGEPCDTRADLFSFGVIMWEVLTHEIPVRGNLRGLHIPEEAPQEVRFILSSVLSCLLA